MAGAIAANGRGGANSSKLPQRNIGYGQVAGRNAKNQRWPGSDWLRANNRKWPGSEWPRANNRHDGAANGRAQIFKWPSAREIGGEWPQRNRQMAERKGNRRRMAARK